MECSKASDMYKEYHCMGSATVTLRLYYAKQKPSAKFRNATDLRKKWKSVLGSDEATFQIVFANYVSSGVKNKNDNPDC